MGGRGPAPAEVAGEDAVGSEPTGSRRAFQSPLVLHGAPLWVGRLTSMGPGDAALPALNPCPEHSAEMAQDACGQWVGEGHPAFHPYAGVQDSLTRTGPSKSPYCPPSATHTHPVLDIKND